MCITAARVIRIQCWHVKYCKNFKCWHKMLLSLLCTCNALSQSVNNVDIAVYGWPLPSVRYLKRVLRKMLGLLSVLTASDSNIIIESFLMQSTEAGSLPPCRTTACPYVTWLSWWQSSFVNKRRVVLARRRILANFFFVVQSHCKATVCVTWA